MTHPLCATQQRCHGNDINVRGCLQYVDTLLSNVHVEEDLMFPRTDDHCCCVHGHFSDGVDKSCSIAAKNMPQSMTCACLSCSSMDMDKENSSRVCMTAHNDYTGMANDMDTSQSYGLDVSVLSLASSSSNDVNDLIDDNTECLFAPMPSEILLHILRCLPSEDIVRFSRTCRMLYIAVSSIRAILYRDICVRRGWYSSPQSASRYISRLPSLQDHSKVDWDHVFNTNSSVEHKWKRGYFDKPVQTFSDPIVMLKLSQEDWGAILDS